jgi:hypothetical protein
MLQNIKKLYGLGLSASDGEIGHVLDLYFDDQSWAVRYVIADAGSWLSERRVLLSPHAFGDFHQAGKHLHVNLTRKQIENSPAIESHKPISRQYEEEYYRYYGWPAYWQGGGLWGASTFPILSLPAESLPGEPATVGRPPAKRAEAHLRSTQAVNGYQLEASDGTIGRLCDFMMDARSWQIRRLVIKTGNWLPGGEVEIPTGKVDRISYDESTVFANLTKQDIAQSPSHNLVLEGAAN